MENNPGDPQNKNESNKSTESQDAGPSCSKKRHYDETAEITEGITRGASFSERILSNDKLPVRKLWMNVGRSFLEDQEMSKLGTIDTKEADIVNVRKPRNCKKEIIQESKSEPKKEYRCDKCARSFAQKGRLNKHKKFECGVKTQFSCKFCDKPFKLKSVMKNHILRVHLKTNRKTSQMGHNCNKCSRTYPSLRALNEHKRAEHAAVKPQFTCDLCGFQTKRKGYLPKHITSRHLSTDQLSVAKKKYKCEKCARSFFQKGSLKSHQKFECDVMPQFRCKFCGKWFKQKGSMNRHILGVHKKTKAKVSQTKHNCDICPRIYSSLSGLNFHKRSEHAVVKPQFICSYCGFRTNYKKILSEHIKSLHSKKFHLSLMPQFICEFCGKQFKRKSNMNRHIRSMHRKTDSKDRKKFTCAHCGYKAKRKDNLSRHIISRHLRKVVVSVPESERRHECVKCGYRCFRKEHLNRHKKKFCDVMTLFRCDLCGEQFKRKRDVFRHILGVHQKTNSKGKPQFTCDFCGYKAKRKDKLSKHIISRHLSKISALIPEPEKRYDCERCGRSYFRKSHLNCLQRF